MKTECVLCTSACFTEHLSADPRELSSVCSGREDEGGGVGLRTIVSKHNGVSEKALQQSLQQPPWYPWKQILICICLWSYSGAWRQRSRRGGARREEWGVRIEENSVCHRRLPVTVRLKQLEPGIRHLSASIVSKCYESDESSWCPGAERGIPSLISGHDDSDPHFLAASPAAKCRIIFVWCWLKHRLCSRLTLPETNALNRRTGVQLKANFIIN